MTADPLAQALVAFRGGNLAAALAGSERVLARSPNHAQALALKANAAMQLGDNDALVAALQRLHALRPDDAPVRRNLATALNRRGNRQLEQSAFAAAEASWRAALEVWPQHRDARFNLAAALRRAEHWAQALALYEALDRELADPEVTLRIAECLAMSGRTAAAAERLRSSEYPPQLLNAVAEVANRCGAIEVAAAHIARAATAAERVDAVLSAQLDAVTRRRDSDALIDACFDPARLGEHSPELQVALTRALALPQTMHDATEIEHIRQRFDAGLHTLVATYDAPRLRRCEPRIAQVAWSNFLLAYQNRDDLELQSRFGDWLAMATSVLGRNLPSIADRRRPGRPRLGLVSSHWRTCTVGSYFGSWIENLAELDVDLHVVHMGPIEDTGTERFATRAPNFHRFGADVDEFIAQTRALDLDLVIYPELGMIQRLFAAAAFGLGRQQWMAWGHPVTSGLPTVSHYLTCGEMEPEGAQRCYREQLLPLPGIGTRYALPPAPTPRTRAELGLPAGRLAVVPQSTFKVLPANDAIYVELLQRDPSLRIAFSGANLTAEDARFRERLRRAAGAELAGRIVFLPELTRERFLETLAACDLMIDTLGWSGGNSALDALRARLPIVTWPGEFMRGRQCATMLRLLGIEGAIAENPERLAALAAERVGDREFAAQFRERASQGLEQLVDDAACGQALRGHVASALGL